MKGKLKDLTFGARGEQYITITVMRDFRQDFDLLKDAEVNVQIKKWREPRSKDANAYFHVLVNKIAEAQNLGNEEVKRSLVIEYGALAKDEDGNTMGAMLPTTADIDEFYPYTRCYKTMVLEGKEYRCYLFYKRTHTLDSKEMSRLIDGAIYVAKGLGVDTETPEQIARYKDEWQTQ
jgi:hypothetical protein